MLWAACCLGFFGYLSCAEFTCPSREAYDLDCHLSLSDTAKQSKTDPFRKGVDILLGRTNQTLCPVAALSAYLQIRGPASGPLFMHNNSATLSRGSLVKALQEALKQCGMDSSLYNGHSFRIGAAITAAAAGVP